jgi:hypothetical protein
MRRDQSRLGDFSSSGGQLATERAAPPIERTAQCELAELLPRRTRFLDFDPT